MCSNYTILVVDDESMMINVCTRLLHRNNYSVTSASDGSEALLKLQTYKPDLILTDLMMPGMDGVDFYTRVNFDNKHKLPFIFMTGLKYKPWFDELIEDGNIFIYKPFTEKDLLFAVENKLIYNNINHEK
jgi:CheY-like chemotaxis protein